MGKISQVKSQGGFPVTIRKLMRLGNASAVTLPPQWVRGLKARDPHYLSVHVANDGSVVVRDLTEDAIRGDVHTDLNSSDRP